MRKDLRTVLLTEPSTISLSSAAAIQDVDDPAIVDLSSPWANCLAVIHRSCPLFHDLPSSHIDLKTYAVAP
jgi:hypothetical protein